MADDLDAENTEYEDIFKFVENKLWLIVSTWHTFRDNFGDFEKFENQTFYSCNKF